MSYYQWEILYVILSGNREHKSTNNRSVLSFGKTEARLQHALGLFYLFIY